jgi:membrane protein DedA with SNARE-associated domain
MSFSDQAVKQQRPLMLNNGFAILVATIVSVISYAGYIGVAILMAIESACVPLPSEIILPFAGYLVSTGRFSLVWVATAGAIGCNLGSTVVYFAAARGGKALVERWGSYLLISIKEIERVQRFFAKYGAITVFIGRLLPVIRTFIALPAGLARMPVLKFQAYTFIGSWIWCYLLGYAGAQLGVRWDSDPTLRSIFHRFDTAILIAFMSAGIWFVWRRVRSRGRSQG